MCFSPEASFIVGSGIAIVGVMTLRKVMLREELVLASIPLLFASQQFIEGFLWLVLLKGGMPASQYWLTQAYSSYAGIIWPVVAPLGILLIEHDTVRRNIMVLVLLASMTIVFATINVLAVGGFNAEIVNQCIRYDHTIYQSLSVTWWSYVGITCLPFFLSSQPVIRWIGAANIATFFIAYHIYSTAYISVWCFFAAITSGFVYFYFSHARQQGISPHNKAQKPVLPALPIEIRRAI